MNPVIAWQLKENQIIGTNKYRVRSNLPLADFCLLDK
jgi:hypothetical protein